MFRNGMMRNFVSSRNISFSYVQKSKSSYCMEGACRIAKRCARVKHVHVIVYTLDKRNREQKKTENFKNAC